MLAQRKTVEYTWNCHGAPQTFERYVLVVEVLETSENPSRRVRVYNAIMRHSIRLDDCCFLWFNPNCISLQTASLLTVEISQLGPTNGGVVCGSRSSLLPHLQWRRHLARNWADLCISALVNIEIMIVHAVIFEFENVIHLFSSFLQNNTLKIKQQCCKCKSKIMYKYVSKIMYKYVSSCSETIIY